jgi:hypothetical protein
MNLSETLQSECSWSNSFPVSKMVEQGSVTQSGPFLSTVSMALEGNGNRKHRGPPIHSQYPNVHTNGIIP